MCVFCFFVFGFVFGGVWFFLWLLLLLLVVVVLLFAFAGEAVRAADIPAKKVYSLLATTSPFVS